MTEKLQSTPPGSERSEVGLIVDEYWAGIITYNEYATALQQEVKRQARILELILTNPTDRNLPTM